MKLAPNHNSDDIPDFISLTDAAKKLNVSERTIIRWAQIGILSVFKVKNITRITRNDFKNFIQANMTSASSPITGKEDCHDNLL